MKRMRNWVVVGLAAVGLMLAAVQPALANNLQVANVAVTPKDATTANVKFDLSWDNSWRYDTVNHDAAWVFFKVQKEGQTTWNHVILEGSGLNPTGYSTGAGTGIEIVVPTDKVGMFVRRSAEGSGTLSVTGVQAVWNFASSGLTPSDKVKMQAFAVEMVYVPQGAYELGDGNGTTESVNAFHLGMSNAKVGTIGTTLVSDIRVDVNTRDDAQIEDTGIGIDGDGGLDANDDGTVDNPDFPTGYKAFYCMKYEITQGQYKDFLNTLTAEQSGSAQRYPNSFGLDRHTITGTSGVPGSFSASSPDRACNYLGWFDGLAFADWAGLRPMTELEFEKACRGPSAAVLDEYAWGTSTIIADSGNGTINVTSPENGTEANTTSVSLGACVWGRNEIQVGGVNSGQGPVRAGLFSTASSTRVQAGASYWGIMELSGNVWEVPVTVGNATCRAFTGLHGDGVLTVAGDADVANWPATGGFRGGSSADTMTTPRVSNRTYAASPATGRDFASGGRAVRSAP